MTTNYTATLAIPAGELDRLERLCRRPGIEGVYAWNESDEVIFDRETAFPDGMRMAIRVVAPTIDPEHESAWTEGVLFDANGCERGCTEPGESAAGEYTIDCDGSTYTAVVAAAAAAA